MYLFIYVYVSISLYVRSYVRPSVCKFLCLIFVYSIRLYVCLSFLRLIVGCPSVCLLVCPSNLMCVCKSDVCMYVRDIPYF